MNRIPALLPIPILPVLAVLALTAFTFAGCSSEPYLDVAPHVDLSRFQGKWYEIASLPRTTQVDCYGTTAFYSQASDGSYRFVNQCNVESTNGPLRTVAMKATVPDQAVPAKLAVDVGGFSGDYWILDVGSNYEYAVVGHPTRMYLWILSRTPTLDQSTLTGILDRAQQNHFNTAKLQYTPQPPPADRLASTTPVEPVSTAASGGCAVSTRGRGAEATWFVGVAVALTMRRRLAGRRRDSPSLGKRSMSSPLPRSPYDTENFSSTTSQIPFEDCSTKPGIPAREASSSLLRTNEHASHVSGYFPRRAFRSGRLRTSSPCLAMSRVSAKRFFRPSAR